MIEDVPLEKLKIRNNRIRKDLGDLLKLMDSMKEVGQLNSLTIDEDYYVIEGTRRYYSAKNLGWSTLKCEKRIGLTDYQKLVIEIDENLRRKNFNPAEEAKALALKKRAYLQGHPERKRGGDRKSEDYKNQTATASVGFAKVQAEKFDTSERTIITKAKIGDYILDQKLDDKTVDKFGKRKLSQRKVLAEIKAIDEKEKDESIPPKKDYAKAQIRGKVKTVEIPAKKQETPRFQKIVKAEKTEEESVKYCTDCSSAQPLTCPNCKDAFISCTFYKNPRLRRLDSVACEKFE
jgi:ParB-like chromosome segregation protein Spo0J